MGFLEELGNGSPRPFSSKITIQKMNHRFWWTRRINTMHPGDFCVSLVAKMLFKSWNTQMIPKAKPLFYVKSLFSRDLGFLFCLLSIRRRGNTKAISDLLEGCQNDRHQHPPKNTKSQLLLRVLLFVLVCGHRGVQMKKRKKQLHAQFFFGFVVSISLFCLLVFF